MVAQGAAFWPLRLARELDDAILDIRLNELDTAVLVFKSEGDLDAVFAYDRFLQANAKHWLAREILHHMAFDHAASSDAPRERVLPADLDLDEALGALFEDLV